MPENLGYCKKYSNSVIYIYEGGRSVVCKAVEEYGDNRAQEREISTKIDVIKNLMVNLKFTFEQAANAIGLSAEEQTIIMARLK